MTQPVLQLKNVTKRFHDETAVENFSLDVHPGEFLTLLGPSGCGKTTILRLLAGFEQPTTGEVILAGRCVNEVPPNQRDVNTVFQSYALFPHMSVFDNVAFGLQLKKTPKKEIRQRVQEALSMVKLAEYAHRRVHQLSGGQQQRVAMARAIVNRPLVLLLDEPLSALDYQLRKTMQLELKRLQRHLGITFIFVTHDQEEALFMSDRVVVMNGGHIEQVGAPQEIYEEPVNMFVARFVGQINVFEGHILTARPEGGYICRLGKTDFPLNTRKSFQRNQPVRILLRPEDLKIERLSDGCIPPYLPGVVEELLYKGSTVDLVIRLDSGEQIFVTEFFNEDAEHIFYAGGEKVCVSWIEGWEVVFSHEE
ncbi:spermidine/putrescine ABC transporter ATP-binding protein PotA [Desulfobotulus sp. H1]|uniref:Spermidine/putrescine import ATP-binding protein PotA n=1 Tax=Desulfobotulus pelophilus TaxID=2823377 RepID=A0ABT3NCH5_9BACT|nr:spermidine/putrescine ABC transporter ATP-binding protein PotA [Desulfobotulus pelophilus]MCW7754876.1 spermidine/putrescine ABC transporter ATP-binding protein PotA [Desulfobotulus pelophilus]